MSRSRLFLARLLLATVVPSLFLGGVELGLRLVGYEPIGPVSLGFGDGDPMLRVSESDPDLLWRLLPNRRLDLADLKIDLNAAGLRGTLPPPERVSDSLRIVCVGDSTAFGNYTTYPAELAAVLAGGFRDTKVEVINGGVPGYSAAQGLELLRRDLLSYRPDIVTWCFGFNNAKDAPGGRNDAASLAAMASDSARKRGWIHRSRFAAWLEEMLGGRQRALTDFSKGTTTFRVSPEEHGSLLRKAAALCEANGAKFVVIEQPCAYTYDDDPTAEGTWDAMRLEPLRRLTAQNEAAARTCAEYAIPFIPMQPEFTRRDVRRLFAGPIPGGDAIHAGPVGLRLFAELLANELVKLGLTPSLATPFQVPRERSAPAFATADLDSDGSFELFAVSVVDGAVVLVSLDPATFGVGTHLAPVPSPTRSCAISTPPLLAGQFLLSWRNQRNALRFESWFFDGTPGAIRGITVPTSSNLEWVRLQPVDFDADGAPEYGVQFGPKYGSGYMLLDQRGGVLATLPARFQDAYGSHLGTTPHPFLPGAERLTVSGVAAESGAVVTLGSGLFPPVATGERLAIAAASYSAHDVRIGPDRAKRISLVGAGAKIVDETGAARFLFPWGCSAKDIDAPGIGIATTRTEKGIADAVLIGSIANRTLHLARFDSNGWKRLPMIALPAEE